MNEVLPLTAGALSETVARLLWPPMTSEGAIAIGKGGTVAQASFQLVPWIGRLRQPSRHSCRKVQVPFGPGAQSKSTPASPAQLGPLMSVSGFMTTSLGRGCAVTASAAEALVPPEEAVMSAPKARPL